MVWTAPMTWTPNSVLTAAQLNIYLRDNMMETEVAKATTATGYFVGTGPNSIAERLSKSHAVGTSESTDATSFEDINGNTGGTATSITVGPTVTVTTGSKALVIIGSNMYTTTAAAARMSVEVTGASSIAPADSRSLCVGIGANNVGAHSLAIWYDTLTPGDNTFTCKYRVTSGFGNFLNRRIVVYPY